MRVKGGLIRASQRNPESSNQLAAQSCSPHEYSGDCRPGFPNFPNIETVDLSLVTIYLACWMLLRAVRFNFVIGRITMAEEFRLHNTPAVIGEFCPDHG